MILIKSKIYESRIFKEELTDIDFREVYLDSMERESSDWGMCYSAGEGYTKLVYFFISIGVNTIEGGIWYAAQGGQKNMIDSLISGENEDWNSGMLYAAESGHINLVNFFISKGATDWKSGTICARKGRYKKLERYLWKKYMKEVHDDLTFFTK